MRTEVLLDEMYSGLQPFLKTLGWRVWTVEDLGLKGAEDVTVVEEAARRGLVLVTQEHRVAELAKLRGVRCVFVGAAEIARVIDAKLREMEEAKKP
jgi:predicted nuclease of predicted toxin-antitoxin system